MVTDHEKNVFSISKSYSDKDISIHIYSNQKMVSIKEKIIRYMKTEGNFHKKKTNKKIIPLL